jgi:hypothetical protein
VQREEFQIGQLAAEVIKLHKEAEAARLEALALDKELQISLLLGRLDLGSLEGQDLPLLEETFQEALNQPNRKLPQQWYKDFHKGHQQANRKGRCLGHQEGHQGGNHQHCPKDHQRAHLDRQGGCQGGNCQERPKDRQGGRLQGNCPLVGRHPMEAMGL